MSKCRVSIVLLLLIVQVMETQGKKYFVKYPPDDYVPVPDFDVAKWGGFYAMNSLFKPEFGIDTKMMEHDPPTRDPTIDNEEEFVMGLRTRPQDRYETQYFQYPPESRTTLGLATHKLKSWWNSVTSFDTKKRENSREVDPRDDPRHYLESNEYFANEYVGLIVRTEDNQVWTKTIAYPGKKLYLRGISRLDEIQMKNQSAIEFKIWISPVDPEKDSSQMVWRNRTCRTKDFDHYTRFGDIHEKVMLWYLISNMGSIQVFVDPRFVPSETCRPMVGNYDPHKLYKNFENPRKDYDWRNDISEYPKIEVDESLIHRGFAEINKEDETEEAEREEPCETKLSRCLSGAEMRQASRRLVKCEAHLSLREAQDVQVTADALDRLETCEEILSTCHEKIVTSEKVLEDMSRREASCGDELSERENTLKDKELKLEDALSRVSDCTAKLSDSTSRTWLFERLYYSSIYIVECYDSCSNTGTVELEKKESVCQEREALLDDALSQVSECTAKLSDSTSRNVELEKKEASLDDALSQVSECSVKLSELTSEVQTCSNEVKTCDEKTRICNEGMEKCNEKVETCNEKERVCNENVQQKGQMLADCTEKLNECSEELSAEFDQEELERICAPHVEIMLQEYQGDATARMSAFRALEKSRDDLLKSLAERREEGLSSMRQQVLMMRAERDTCMKQVNALKDLDITAATCNENLLSAKDEASTTMLELQKCSENVHTSETRLEEMEVKCNQEIKDLKQHLEDSQRSCKEMEVKCDDSKKDFEDTQKRCDEIEAKCEEERHASEKRVEEMEAKCEEERRASENRVEEMRVKCEEEGRASEKRVEEMEAKCEEERRVSEKRVEEIEAKCEEERRASEKRFEELQKTTKDTSKCEISEDEITKRVENECAKIVEGKISVLEKECKMELEECDLQCKHRLDSEKDLEKRLEDCSRRSEDFEVMVKNVQLEVTKCDEERSDLSSSLSSYETRVKECEDRLEKEQKECEINEKKSKDEAFRKGTVSVCETILGTDQNCEDNPTEALLSMINTIRDRNTKSESSSKSIIFEKQFRDRLDNLSVKDQDLLNEYKLFYYAVLFLVLIQPFMALIFAKRISGDVVGYIEDTAKEMNDYFNTYMNKNV